MSEPSKPAVASSRQNSLFSRDVAGPRSDFSVPPAPQCVTSYVVCHETHYVVSCAVMHHVPCFARRFVTCDVVKCIRCHVTQDISYCVMSCNALRAMRHSHMLRDYLLSDLVGGSSLCFCLLTILNFSIFSIINKLLRRISAIHSFIHWFVLLKPL